MAEELWSQLVTKDILTRGWHLARLDTRQDFGEDLFATDVYASQLKLNIIETVNRLKTETLQPRPLLRLDVPKGSLGFRPGAVIPINDRVVLSAIIYLIAPYLDKLLPDSVYSWRLKENPTPKKGSIFNETDITDLPYLKKRTIKVEIDPFESWYDVWPEFDEESKNAFLSEGYQYLATTDIAAYFENIQLPIFRDHLLRRLSDNTKIVNLLFTFLESWAHRTPDGRPHLRGIPQGTFISSFLGNIFLLPLDEEFKKFESNYDALYFRYMDDARIFTKHITDARRAVFTMDRTLRKLHLNVQTAKTKILDEKHGEISNLLIDDRLDDLNEIINELEALNLDKMTSKQKREYLRSLDEIAHREKNGRQKILGSQRSLEGLTARAFHRWMYAHKLLRSDKYIDRLLNEIKWNPEFKLTKKLISTVKVFPRKSKIESCLLNFIKSDKNIFSHQEAECLRAFRYLNILHDDLISHCKSRLSDRKAPTYLRMQAAYVLSRTRLSARYLSMLNRKFDSENDPYVQASISRLLVQRKSKNDEIIQKIVFHPNEKIRELGRHYMNVKNDRACARNILNHVFNENIPWLICDNIPYIFLMSITDNVDIKSDLIKYIRDPRYNHPISDIRRILRYLFTRTNESLKSRI